ncbi:MAG: phosphate/phosphite/phosphonate ABC transporter substrate-binding protein [Campylobacterales bacterium]|nr:phosphate/phosphite/phosphonate ABC transporter substrate-binding protein [Campylobacterales bacterium]
MNRTFLLILLFITNLFSLEKTIVFGIPPWIEKSLLEESAIPLIKHIENNIGIPVEFDIANDYSDAIKKLKVKKYDIAILGGISYVRATKIIPDLNYIGTVQRRGIDGKLKNYFQSLLLVRKDRGINTLKDLKGKKFAFSDFQSDSGYVYPMYYFKMKNIIPKNHFSKIFMLKKLTKVAKAVAEGAIDGGATFDGAYDLVNSQYGDNLKVLDKIGDIPNELMVAGSHLEKKLLKRIEKAVLSYRFETIVPETYVIANRFIKLDDSAYDLLRKVESSIVGKKEK